MQVGNLYHVIDRRIRLRADGYSKVYSICAGRRVIGNDRLGSTTRGRFPTAEVTAFKSAVYRDFATAGITTAASIAAATGITTAGRCR